MEPILKDSVLRGSKVPSYQAYESSTFVTICIQTLFTMEAV